MTTIEKYYEEIKKSEEQRALHVLDGPLPSGWRIMRCPDTRLVYFVDDSNKATSWTDPRWPLPGAWVEKKDPKGGSFFLDKSIESQSPTLEDPRGVLARRLLAYTRLPLPQFVDVRLDSNRYVFFADSHMQTTSWTDPRNPLQVAWHHRRIRITSPLFVSTGDETACKLSEGRPHHYFSLFQNRNKPDYKTFCDPRTTLTHPWLLQAERRGVFVVNTATHETSWIDPRDPLPAGWSMDMTEEDKQIFAHTLLRTQRDPRLKSDVQELLFEVGSSASIPGMKLMTPDVASAQNVVSSLLKSFDFAEAAGSGTGSGSDASAGTVLQQISSESTTKKGAMPEALIASSVAALASSSSSSPTSPHANKSSSSTVSSSSDSVLPSLSSSSTFQPAPSGEMRSGQNGSQSYGDGPDGIAHIVEGPESPQVGSVEANDEDSSSPSSSSSSSSSSLMNSSSAGPAVAAASSWIPASAAGGNRRSSIAGLPVGIRVINDTYQTLYEKESKLDRGAFGMVWKVLRKSDGKMFVMKEMDLNKADHEQRRVAKQEGQLHSMLNNPYVVRHEQTFVTSQAVWVVMEFCPSGSLWDLIAHRRANFAKLGYWPEDQVMWWLVQLVQAVAHVHEMNIVHLDIKPANLLLAKDWSIRLCDFGLSVFTTSKKIHIKDSFAGTPAYASPEQMQGLPPDQKTDVWAIGVILYMLCTLTPPFGDLTARAGPIPGKMSTDETHQFHALRKRILTGPYPPLPPHFGKDLNSLLAKLLAKKSRFRPELSEVLQLPIVQKFIDQQKNTTPKN